MAEAEPVKMVKVQCQDGVYLDKDVNLYIFKPCNLVREMYADFAEVDEGSVVPFLNQKKEVMEHVVSFLEEYHKEPMKPIDKPLKTKEFTELVQPQFSNFITQWANPDTVRHVFELVDAANFLGIEPLLSLGLSWMACVIKGIPLEELKKMIVIHNDLTPEEEAIFRKMYLDEKKAAFRAKVEAEKANAPKPPTTNPPPAPST